MLKVYGSEDELAHRFGIFQQNLARIDALNNGESQKPFGTLPVHCLA